MSFFRYVFKISRRNISHSTLAKSSNPFWKFYSTSTHSKKVNLKHIPSDVLNLKLNQKIKPIVSFTNLRPFSKQFLNIRSFFLMPKLKKIYSKIMFLTPFNSLKLFTFGILLPGSLGLLIYPAVKSHVLDLSGVKLKTSPNSVERKSYFNTLISLFSSILSFIPMYCIMQFSLFRANNLFILVSLSLMFFLYLFNLSLYSASDHIIKLRLLSEDSNISNENSNIESLEYKNYNLLNLNEKSDSSQYLEKNNLNEKLKPLDCYQNNIIDKSDNLKYYLKYMNNVFFVGQLCYRITRVVCSLPISFIPFVRDHYEQWICDEITKLGPLFIKMGQWLATRPDINSITRLFRTLLSNNYSAVDINSYNSVFEAVYGENYMEIVKISSLLATGSVASVWHGYIDGEPRAFKLLHPGIHHAAEINIIFLGMLLNIADPLLTLYNSISQNLKRSQISLDLYSAYNENISSLISQLDLKNESKNSKDLSQNYNKSTFQKLNTVFRTIIKEFKIFDSNSIFIHFTKPLPVNDLSYKFSLSNFITRINSFVINNISEISKGIKYFNLRLRDLSIYFPRIYKESVNLLEEEYIEGILLSEYINSISENSSSVIQYQNTLISISLLRYYIKSIVYDNFFHGDLHAGNIILNQKGISIIDFGLASSLSSADFKNIRDLLFHWSIGNYREAADLFISRSRYLLPGEEKCKEFSQKASDILRDRSSTLYKRFFSIANVAKETGIRLESSYVSVILALLLFEGISLQVSNQPEILENIALLF